MPLENLKDTVEDRGAGTVCGEAALIVQIKAHIGR